MRTVREEGMRTVLRHERGWAAEVSPVCGEEGVGWGPRVDDCSGCFCLLGY